MGKPLPIAIVGAACRLPGADGLPAFAELLWAGRDAVDEIPDERWSKARFLHPTVGQPGKTYTFAAACLPDVYGFDAGFFGISPREALSIDPQQRLLLELAYEAMEDAGVAPSRLAGSSAGVYVGGSSWDFAARSFADVAALDAYAMQGAALSSMANRISYLFSLRGPSLTVDTACSSSLVALHLACEAMRRDEIGCALVGGVNLLLAPQSFVGFARATMLSPRGRCRPFDAGADGYVRGEGGVVIMLKPLAQALADGDRVQGVIRATGVNQDGRTNGFSLPSRDAQAALLDRIYTEAEIEPDAIGYFEAHGTGTPAGDPIEAQAIGEALAQRRQTPLLIGSVKSNIGHLEPASGLAGLVKLLLAFDRGSIPPSLNCATPNPRIAFDALNIEVVSQARPLLAGQAGAIAGLNSFGFGGTNAHAVLAAPPLSDPVPALRTPGAAPLLISARSAEALGSLAMAWRDRLAATAAADLPALLRGAAHCREQFSQRIAVTGDTPQRLAAQLDSWLGGETLTDVTSGTAETGALAFVFSGNGSQWAGMGRDAWTLSAAFRRAIEEVDALLAPRLGWSVASRLHDEALLTSLRNTAVAQPLLFAVQVAAVSALRAQGVRAVAHVGHSAGEVAAAWASGALTLAQACHVIVHRSLAQQATHDTGRMGVLGLDAVTAAAKIARERLEIAIAAINARASVTVAGTAETMARLQAIAIAEDWSFTLLDLDYAFHSPAMDPIEERLLAALGDIVSAAPADTLVSSVTGHVVSAGELDAEYWWRNVRQPVLFSDALDCLTGRGVRLLLEVGPQPVLQASLRDGLKRAGQPGRVLFSLSRQLAGADPFTAIAAACHVAGASIAGSPALAGAASGEGLPRYPWQHQSFRTPRTVEGTDIAVLTHEHPLLGFRDPLANATWTSHLSTAVEPWLADHVVDGVPLLPAAAMIDMTLAAARALHPDAPVLEIQDFEINRSMPLEGERECRASVDADSGFTLESRPRLSTEPMTLHAAGRIIAGQRATPIIAWDAPVQSGECVAAEAVYAAAAALRLSYGPAFRTVAQVWSGDGAQSVAALTAPVVERVALGYLLDPALLDGSLQALLALLAGQGSALGKGGVVPWRFGHIRLLRPQGAVPAFALLRRRHAGPRSIWADIALTDSDGAIIAELIDCWFVALPSSGSTAADQTFWTAHVPSARQLPGAIGDASLEPILDAMAGDGVDGSGSILLADACAAATVFETVQLLAPGGLLPAATMASHLQMAAMGWLEQEGLAEPAADGWRLAAVSDLPASAELWRTLFFDLPEAAAECAVLAALGPALTSASMPDPLLPPALLDQAMVASPASRLTIDALLRGLHERGSHWPRGACLRVAFAGVLPAVLLRRVVAWAESRGVVLRLLAVAHAEEALAALQSLLAETPGSAAKLWDTLSLEERHGFDVVLGLYALSGPAAVRATPEALAGLLAPGGVLLAAEPTDSRIAGLLFGSALLTSPMLRPIEAWRQALQHAGCAVATQPIDTPLWPVALLAGVAASGREAAAPVMAELVVFTAPDDPLAAALAARQRVPRLLPIEALKDSLAAASVEIQPIVILAPGAPDDDWAERLTELMTEIAAALHQWAAAAQGRLWLVARGLPSGSILAAALSGLRRVIANELPGLECRMLCLDPALTGEEAAERVMLETAQPDDEREIWWTPAGRLVPRLRRGLPLPVASDAPRRLDVARPGLIGSLAWQPLDRRPPGVGEVAIEVRAAALNFRDVMWAQGLLPDEALLHGFSGPSLGLECAGVVTAVGDGVTDFAPGDRVIAVAPAALATHVVTRSNGVMPLPAGLDFAAGATIPVAFMTAAYALGHLARLAPGERVLIHGGAGGVGLAAIQYALHKNAEVYTTAGSPVRRRMLALLGVAGVFDSRSAAFADDVLAATGGEGVDVVLNSLSGELMQQSLQLLRPFGRFIEIGKRDLYRNTRVGIRPMRHNAAYFAVDSDELVALRPEIGSAVLREVTDLLAAGRLLPLPYRAFGFADVVDAFRLLQSSGHVGKLVLLPEPTRPVLLPAAFALRTDGVYVVTGGLSGFGLEAARWLVQHGARSLALLGRRGADTPGAAAVLAEFAAADVTARAYACDVAEEGPLAQTLDHIRHTMGPLQGVLHAAMVLDDALLGDLDAARFAAVMRPKLAGAVSLDRLTRQDDMHLFVVFSSVTTVIGTPGQAAYVAANAAMEALAQRRHAAGLPALAVLWGPIGDAGYVARKARVGEMLAKMLGAAHLTAASALAQLPMLLQSGACVAGLADVAWGELRGKLPGLAGPFWSERPAAARRASNGLSRRASILDLPAEAATAMLLEVLVEAIAGILKQAPGSINADAPVAEFGVDSLMAVELRTAVEAQVGVQLPLLVLGAGTTLRGMAARMRQTIQSGGASEADNLAATVLRHEGMSHDGAARLAMQEQGA